MELILGLDDRFPEVFSSLDIKYSEFVDGYPTRVITDGVFRGDFRVTHFEVR